MKTFIALALVTAAVVSNAALYDFAADFSIANGNPNGAWSYGYRPNLLAGRTLFTLPTGLSDYQYWTSPGLSGDGTPSVFKRTSGTVNGINAGEAGLHPGPGGEYASLLFTAPEGGLLTLESDFGAGDSGDVDLQVRVNGLPVYNATDVTDNRSFDLSTPVSISQGDTLEILVGGSGDYRFDSVPVSARINIGAPVPEPATMAALGLGAVALLRRRRKA